VLIISHSVLRGTTTYLHNNADPQLENGRLSYRYRIGTDTGCIVSNGIGYCCIGRYYVHHCRFINRWRIVLHTMIKRSSSDPSPARRTCTVLWSMIRERVGGEGGGRRL